MVEVPDIRFLVEDFRAIKQADITVNGITVVAGENGAGKSSISKLLYFLYRTVADFENIVKNDLLFALEDIAQFIDIMAQDYRILNGEKRGPRRFTSILRKSIQDAEELENALNVWTEAIYVIETAYTDQQGRPSFGAGREQRVQSILKDVLNRDEEENIDLVEAFDALRTKISQLFQRAEEIIRERPNSVFVAQLAEVFAEGRLPEKFEVFEYGSPILSLKNKQLAIPYNIQNAIYIDSPMLFFSAISSNQHWVDLFTSLKKERKNGSNIADLINKQIIQGEVSAEDATYRAGDFKFQRADGEIFNLLDVATGVKSFAILQLLLKNGSINDKTLLIIDEPESHLHPQWIIEYARIIVLLNKHIGVKFFLATHNPDMVSAIRYISEKEGTLDKVNYYLAETSDEQFKYSYKHLGKEIDPIFASFNIAIDRINQYGI